MNEQQAIWAVVYGLGALVNIAVGLSIIWINNRQKDRDPPIPEEMARDYATKDELKSFRCEWQTHCAAQHTLTDSTIGKLFDLDRDSERKLHEWQVAVSRQLGRIEQMIVENRK